jgi:predicted TIM-barrel fold metal-dependent hydrolase
MPMLIDWHAHHTPPELVAEIAALGGRAPKPDAFDSPRFSKRIAEMDGAGIEMQLVSQGAGLNADQLPPEAALDFVRKSNELIAERVALYPDRLFGSIAFTWADPLGSAAEIEHMAAQGFRALFMYARADMIGREEVEPIFETTARLGLPIFLHGGGGQARNDPDLARLEDGGQGVVVSAHADAAVSDCVVRMIAAGLFDRYPNLQVVIRSSGGGVPLLLNKLWWKHKGAAGEQRYSEVLLQHFSVDCASAHPRTLQFLIDTMGETRVVFGSDFCGGLGPLERALTVIDEQPQPQLIRELTERNSRALLHL